MKKLHLALAVADIDQSVCDYTIRFGQAPDLVIPDAYALWRTAHLNVSIRKVGSQDAGQLRHLGWESGEAETFTTETDCNGILWEYFSAEFQAQEIKELWPNVVYEPKDI